MVDEADNKRTHVDAAPPAHDERLPDGTDVNGYIVDGVIGRGGMGVVYSATHAVIGKRAAIKVLAPHLATSAAARENVAGHACTVLASGHGVSRSASP